MRRLGGSDQHPVHHLLLTCVIGLIVSSCALAYPPSSPTFAPEAAHHPEVIAALLAAPVGDLPAFEADFSVTVPAILFSAGADLRVRCYVPPQFWTSSAIGVGIPGVRWSSYRLEQIEHLITIRNVPCGTHRVVCALSDGPMRYVEVTAKGLCNSDG